MRFTKMEGLGNDYVYVNCFREKVYDPEILARLVSDRHRGIGGDGLILIGPSARADFNMDIYNADGSRAEMCGNGIRCLGKYVYDHGMTEKTEFTVETQAGIKRLRCPDPTANPYLAMAVCLKAGLDGIKRQLPVPPSVDTNIFNLTAEEKKARHIHSLPANLREATLAMSESDFMKEAVGSHIFERYTSAKMDEWNEYTRQVTDWEISNYLYKV